MYRYVVWWHYRPKCDIRCHFHSSEHKRYLPYHFVGERRQKDVWRDRPCNTDPCPNRMLEHIVIFHAGDYKLQPRWHELNAVDLNATYIGFHTTTAQAAVAIAHSDFRPSSSGMLGSGAYFARSIEDTFGKANSHGA
ncbi:unnamed protein product [Rotaria sp. Silwood2]|nr:unnamed protein product [Rotaria sp. Silwood2]CAF3077688.1 unnamed protein product [Rotaria sp. Silwood2]CAF3939512.1 unnamed protein product [Rotaria sp. Silwood2]CAF4081024.1 unnamed protein product [Rotaria sp. Silwood2]